MSEGQRSCPSSLRELNGGATLPVTRLAKRDSSSAGYEPGPAPLVPVGLSAQPSQKLAQQALGWADKMRGGDQPPILLEPGWLPQAVSQPGEVRFVKRTEEKQASPAFYRPKADETKRFAYFAGSEGAEPAKL